MGSPTFFLFFFSLIFWLYVSLSTKKFTVSIYKCLFIIYMQSSVLVYYIHFKIQKKEFSNNEMKCKYELHYLLTVCGVDQAHITGSTYSKSRDMSTSGEDLYQSGWVSDCCLNCSFGHWYIGVLTRGRSASGGSKSGAHLPAQPLGIRAGLLGVNICLLSLSEKPQT
jgi:hypothetical protein